MAIKEDMQLTDILNQVLKSRLKWLKSIEIFELTPKHDIIDKHSYTGICWVDERHRMVVTRQK